MKDTYDTTENMRGGARPRSAPERAASLGQSLRRWSLALGLAAGALAPAACGGDALGDGLEVAFRDATDSTTEAPVQPSTGAGVCGDHVVEGLEQCDDGNFVDGDGCEHDCTLTVATCEAYCDVYLTACAGVTEYSSTDECLQQCMQWPAGTRGDVSGDSLECRLHRAVVARWVNPNANCPHAGPSGGGVCVAAGAPNCEDYCDAYLANCTGNNNEYVDEADCLDQCSHWWPGVTGATDGDSVGCRAYHAGGPASTDPAIHCPPAGPRGSDVCVPPA